jgi:hypothetical protein
MDDRTSYYAEAASIDLSVKISEKQYSSPGWYNLFKFLYRPENQECRISEQLVIESL